MIDQNQRFTRRVAQFLGGFESESFQDVSGLGIQIAANRRDRVNLPFFKNSAYAIAEIVVSVSGDVCPIT